MSTMLEFDLCELETFLQVFKERGIFKAYSTPGDGLPVVSNNLACLQRKFDDDLFTGPGCEPTEKCRAVLRMLMPIMEDLHLAIEALPLPGDQDRPITAMEEGENSLVCYES